MEPITRLAKVRLRERSFVICAQRNDRHFHQNPNDHTMSRPKQLPALRLKERESKIDLLTMPLTIHHLCWNGSSF